MENRKRSDTTKLGIATTVYVAFQSSPICDALVPSRKARPNPR